MAGGARDRPTKSAYTVGLRALAQRERSTHDLRRVLARKGYVPEAIETAVARLTAHGALDDRRAATSMARRQMRLGRSVARTRAELLAHGFERSIVGEVLAELGSTEHDSGALARAVSRMAPALSTPAAIAKALRRLHRLGFDLTSIRAALAEHGAAVPEADDTAFD